jgi:hypothetical protein
MVKGAANSKELILTTSGTMQIGLLEPRYHVQKMQHAAKELESAAGEVRRATREEAVGK